MPPTMQRLASPMTASAAGSGWARYWLMLALLVLPALSFAQTSGAAGFSQITVHDPVSDGAMPGLVFYPTAEDGEATSRGPYRIQATANAPPTPDAKPLVVISHGHGGSNFGHHDLAVYLARHGFIVATLEHPGDNFRDMSGTGTPAVFGGRPIQVQATISMLLDDPRWGSFIDPDRIGVAGFSAGGYTALLLAGAVPRLDRFIGYCERQPQDLQMCGPLHKLGSAEAITARLATWQGELDQWGNTNDLRVKAAFVMAPLSLVFDKAGLENIDRPLFLYYSENDPVLLPQENALHISPLLDTVVETRMIPEAGHFVFLAPCSPELTLEAPDICVDPPGVDRVSTHAGINADALEFFQTTLSGAEP